MDSSESSLLLQEDRLAYIRTRNKILITIIFSLIIALALIIGGIIVSFVLQDDFMTQSPSTNPAVEVFCSASESKLDCINSLSSSVKTTRDKYPALVCKLSLEAALRKLSQVGSILSRPNSALKNCRVSMRGLDKTLAIMRVDPDMEMLAFVRRGGMVLWIEEAMEALRFCVEDLENTEARERVQEVQVLLRNSRDFLGKFEWVNFTFQENYGYWSIREILENVATVSFVWVAVFGLDFSVFLASQDYSKVTNLE